MEKTERFLNLYKTYESLLREHEKDYKLVEESADDVTLNRMRIMRQIRNYLSHNADPAFLAVTEQQIRMLEFLIKEEEQARDLVKKHLLASKRAACEENDAFKDVLLKMSKQRLVNMPVLREDKVLGVINIFKAIKAYMGNPDGALSRKTYGAYEKSILYVAPDMLVEDVRSECDGYVIICCTKDGTPVGKFLGIWKDESAA